MPWSAVSRIVCLWQSRISTIAVNCPDATHVSCQDVLSKILSSLVFTCSNCNLFQYHFRFNWVLLSECSYELLYLTTSWEETTQRILYLLGIGRSSIFFHTPKCLPTWSLRPHCPSARPVPRISCTHTPHRRSPDTGTSDKPGAFPLL